MSLPSKHLRQGPKIDANQLTRLYQQVAKAYPEVETIYLVQDNWPVHFYAEVIGQLQPQKWPWPFNVPEYWPDLPDEPVARDPLPIQLLCLPSYASRLNPIEKLWRWLKQEVIHLHRLAEAWDMLKGRVASFLGGLILGALRGRIPSTASVYRPVARLICKRPSSRWWCWAY